MKRTLSQTQLKWIAVVFMTIDHIGVYCRAVPVIGDHYDIFRLLGRIAAPVFLYCMIESLRYTRSRWKLLGRLALWNAAGAVVFAAANGLVFLPYGHYALGIPGILMTFFYMTVLVMLSDSFLAAWREKSVRRFLRAGLVCAGLAALYVVQPALVAGTLTLTGSYEAQDLIRALVPQPFAVDYTPVFLLLGLAWYYVRDRRAQIGIYLGFCVLCTAGVALDVSSMIDFFNPVQRWMFLAAPLLACYSGERGKGSRHFFYIYYPLHILALSAIELLLT